MNYNNDITTIAKHRFNLIMNKYTRCHKGNAIPHRLFYFTFFFESKSPNVINFATDHTPLVIKQTIPFLDSKCKKITAATSKCEGGKRVYDLKKVYLATGFSGSGSSSMTMEYSMDGKTFQTLPAKDEVTMQFN